ncbi:MAG: imelysin family protein, partial [Bacteroidota bacterium]
MLAGWMDEVVLPNYRELATALGTLEAAALTFTNSTDEPALSELRFAFRDAYLSFQKASPFATGKPEEIRLREQFNTYPTDTDMIGENLTADEIPNLNLPSQTPAQGFPALEYLLYTNT